MLYAYSNKLLTHDYLRLTSIYYHWTKQELPSDCVFYIPQASLAIIAFPVGGQLHCFASVKSKPTALDMDLIFLSTLGRTVEVNAVTAVFKHFSLKIELMNSAVQ